MSCDVYERMEALAKEEQQCWSNYVVKFRDGYEFEVGTNTVVDAVNEATDGGGRGRTKDDVQCVYEDTYQLLYGRKTVYENKDLSQRVLNDVVDILFEGQDYNYDYDLGCITPVGDGHSVIISQEGVEYRLTVTKEAL